MPDWDCKKERKTEQTTVRAKYIIFRVSLISLDEQRQVKHIQSSGMLRLSLHKNEEVSDTLTLLFFCFDQRNNLWASLNNSVLHF